MAEISRESVNALRTLRTWAKGGYVSASSAAKAVDVLDNAGVFAAIDTATGYDVDAPAPDPEPLDPAEWGDTTRGDLARHQSTDFSDTHPRAARELGELITGSDDADGRF